MAYPKLMLYGIYLSNIILFSILFKDLFTHLTIFIAYCSVLRILLGLPLESIKVKIVLLILLTGYHLSIHKLLKRSNLATQTDSYQTMGYYTELLHTAIVLSVLSQILLS